MQKRLFIIGAGGFGRELEGYLKEVPDNVEKEYELIGYLDDNPDALHGKYSEYKVVGNITSYPLEKKDLVLLAIADIPTKIRIYNLLKDKVSFFSFISRDTSIGPNVKIGEGAIVCPGVKLGTDMQLGKMVSLNVDTIIGHDAKIGDFCSFMPNVDIGGGTIVGDNVFMGTKATVAPRLKITSETYLGIGSVSIKDTLEPGTYFGNPARRMR